jgi:hypothetical protein
MNNVELAIQKIRQLQQMMYDTNVSVNDCNTFLEKNVITQMDKATVEINQNYAEISKKLTDQFNTGKPQ